MLATRLPGPWPRGPPYAGAPQGTRLGEGGSGRGARGKRQIAQAGLLLGKLTLGAAGGRPRPEAERWA